MSTESGRSSMDMCLDGMASATHSQKCESNPMLDTAADEEPSEHFEAADIVPLGNLSYLRDGSQRHMLWKIVNIVLDDWMYGYGSLYQFDDYHLLQEAIYGLLKKQLPLKFLLPAFPCKSINKKDKVFGIKADFGEFIAIRNILTTLRKLEAVYEHGVEFIIMSDYHTYEQYWGVKQEEYDIYHASLKRLIDDLGARDVIKVISLTTYEEFKSTPLEKISEQLFERFGDKDFFDVFDERLSTDDEFLQTYTRWKKFHTKEQAYRLPVNICNAAARNFVEKIARGFMNQGVALERFLRLHNPDCVRMSIHNHHPKKGRFAMALFKGSIMKLNITTTPWMNGVCFDAMKGNFIVEPREKIEFWKPDSSCLLKVNYNGDMWFYLLASKTAEYTAQALESCLEVSMDTCSSGILIQSKAPDINLNWIETSCITPLIKEFGVVVFRGFSGLDCKDEMLDFYKGWVQNGMTRGHYGYIGKVESDEKFPCISVSNQATTMCFDLAQPPHVVEIGQQENTYQDYGNQELVLFYNYRALEKCGRQTACTDIDVAAPRIVTKLT